MNELISEVLRLYHASEQFTWAEILKRHPDCEGAVLLTVFDDLPTPPEREMLLDLLRAQPVAKIYMLLAIWRLGRGDFDPHPETLFDEYLDIADSFPNVAAVVKYLMGKCMSPFLERALRLLKRGRIDLTKVLG